jgi:guanosine-3',5'-bis(diphosphate) 3'-pyrophosphohydrolase
MKLLLKSDKVVKALAFATQKHAGQTRWDKSPYINHPIAVAEQFPYRTDLQVIALLHDTLEDTHTTFKELVSEFGLDIARDVEMLSKLKGEQYSDFIIRIATSGSERAVRVKIADLTHNLSDLKNGAMRDKYELALHILKRRTR